MGDVAAEGVYATWLGVMVSSRWTISGAHDAGYKICEYCGKDWPHSGSVRMADRWTPPTSRPTTPPTNQHNRHKRKKIVLVMEINLR